AALRREFADALAKARALRSRLRALADVQQERRQRLEFLRFQHREMSELRLGEGEFEQLVAEHQVLANLDALRQRLQEALAALQDGEPNTADLLAQASRSLRDAAAVDRRLEDGCQQLGDAAALVADVCRKVQSGLARAGTHPPRVRRRPRR